MILPEVPYDGPRSPDKGGEDDMNSPLPTLDITPRVARGQGRNPRGSQISQLKRAVLYLRVSTPSQVNTDYNPEGISIPAQRDGVSLKAASLGADIVREFIEPGRTATSIDKRPVFQEMMAWVKEQKNIDYIIVYHFNRIFRNGIDAAITKKELGKCSTRVVSSILDMGESPESRMVEGILSYVDQYQSEASGADIRYKMGAKARNGGTLGRAPLGYLNKRDLTEGRNIGTVEIDAERAPFVRLAFELYATGDYSLEQLADELTYRGLRTRPGRHPASPVSTSKLQEMLRDRYYIGYVSYGGEEFRGRHEGLLNLELFDRVQDILDKRGGNGVRRRQHHHYLKGSLWCWQCHENGRESRMVLQQAKGRGGTYLYFFCTAKQQHACDSRYVETGALEAAIVDYYATVKIPDELARPIRSLIEETVADQEQASKLLHQQLTTELRRLDKQEENLLDLASDGAMASSKVRARLQVIGEKRNRIEMHLEEADERLATGAALAEAALKLLADPQELYRRCGPEQRRLLNQAIFDKFYILEDRVIEATFKPPFDELMEVKAAWSSAAFDQKRSTAVTGWAGSAGTLAGVLFAGGSNKGVMVEPDG
jgi:DNA invertase Pin-like site-specific DNA recombinase